jgi:hypothetical protein
MGVPAAPKALGQRAGVEPKCQMFQMFIWIAVAVSRAFVARRYLTVRHVRVRRHSDLRYRHQQRVASHELSHPATLEPCY